MSEIILEMKNIEKYFSGVHALKSAQLELYSGEVHALMGENGAGKSTLVKILCGIHRRDGGSVRLFGEEVDFAGISESQAAGISVIHQELNMMKDLTVAQNIYIGREPMKGIFIDDGAMLRDTAELFQRIGVNIDPSARLGSLTVGKQQMVEIAKAISRDCRLLVLDEPTAALTHKEVEELFKIMADLKSRGIGMIYISHRMDEIDRISDRVTVMRDGEYVGTLITENTTRDEIVRMMVGRVITGERKAESRVPAGAETVLEVQELYAKDVKGVSFKLKKGEILGFAGLMGAGRTEVARAVYGADPIESGTIKINGKDVNIASPKDAVKQGICYLSEDRKRYGLLLDKSVAENSALAALDRFISGGFIRDAEIQKTAEETNSALRTKSPSMAQRVKNLSGGNQQKVIVARWLIRDSDIFIFDEPTRGIDIGAKSEMYSLMEKLAEEGKSIIMISSELAEIQRLSDRVIVMCEGRITGELSPAMATQEEIMKYATMRKDDSI